jgi:hypothetical protein
MRTSDELDFGALLEVLDDERFELLCDCGYRETVSGLDLAVALAEGFGALQVTDEVSQGTSSGAAPGRLRVKPLAHRGRTGLGLAVVHLRSMPASSAPGSRPNDHGISAFTVTVQ